MNDQRLLERRRWFWVFPEGTLEFNIITRVLALLMLIALAIVGGTQRPFVLVGLFGILWLDYILLLWWAVQVATDLRVAADGATPGDASSRRISIAVRAALPSVAAMVGIMPWDRLAAVVTDGGLPAIVSRGLPLASGLVFLGLLWPAQRALRSIPLGSAMWTLVFLLPLLHYFALHRLASSLDAQLSEQLQARGTQQPAALRGSAALIIADVTWVLSVLPWAIIIGVVLVRGWPAGGTFKIAPVCGTLLAAFFAIANLAAMEAVQRKIVALMRKA